MMDYTLGVRHIAERAEQIFPEREVVGLAHDGSMQRSTYAEVVARARALASALGDLGIRPGDRVATFAWNSIAHLELYLALPCMGAVLHTLNIRLFEQDMRYIVSHAGDRAIFLDASLAQMMPHFDGVEHEVVIDDGSGGAREGAHDYEALIASGDRGFAFPDVDENAAAAMCYTSGTTGRPKGVVYSHRSTLLHSMVALSADAMAMSNRDTVLPVVPMFHANAWGTPYSAALCGAKQVFPGSHMQPREIAELIASEGVTLTAGVPTIWNGFVALEDPPAMPTLREVVCGGSAVPESLARAFEAKYGVPVLQAWGMTETSPLASVARLPEGELDVDTAYEIRATQGRVAPLVDFRIDEESGGELQVRGPWIARDYYNDDSSAEKFTSDGWLRTGDVAELRHGNYIQLVDRTKDLVKSGGEWISSVELENAIMAHPDVAEAAVIAVPDERWSERPCACVVVKQGASLDADTLRDFLTDKVAKWWLPDRVELIDEVPKTSVGKFDKKVLRARFVGSGSPVGAGGAAS